MKVVCKHCGSEDGFYIKTRFYANVNVEYNNDGSSRFSGVSDTMESKMGKNVYCINCDKAICKVSEIEDELED